MIPRQIYAGLFFLLLIFHSSQASAQSPASGPGSGSSSNSGQSSLQPTKPPFPTDANAPKTNGSEFLNMYDRERQEDVVPFDQPHRTTEQVAGWAEDQVTNSMNIDATKWEEHLKKITPYFDGYGLQEYQAYLKSSGILALLQANQLKLNAIANGNSVLLSQGALSGSYHWLYQLPVMLTYYNQDTTTLKGSKVKSQNQKIMVRVQLGRVRKGADDNNIVIERWSVVPVR